MRAVRLHGFGGVDQLRLDDVPVPTPGPGEVRIKVGAAAVNPIDWKIRKGSIPGLNITLPFTLGCEGVGTISALGEGVQGYELGQRVWSFTDVMRSGWYAEEVVVPATSISMAPPKLDDAHAASMPVGAVTARQAFERANLKAAERVLVIGGAGSIGSLAIQVAKHMSAWVFATASGRNQEFLVTLRADKALNYEQDDVAAATKTGPWEGVDVVFDAVGGAAADAAYDALREGGRFISIVQPPDEAKLAAHKATGFMHRGTPDALKLIEATAHADLEILRPSVAEIMRLSDFARAHAMSESGHVRGKLILIP
ncbi:NADP-dependent oxidoreductase [Roseiterribacter gracilis]|uniref:NADPH:quinone reductase n=1 Tax=Roseiterribacter gracilis TaxID=2812848 RepID=A0A8S8X7R4_9PROT|nr:NADPH:quinone reductase [Rhodospirillales bacterium TMPK1]